MARNIICDKNVPEVLKKKIYKTAICPAMAYGGDCWAIRKCEQNQMNTTEMKMLRWIQGKTRKGHFRNVVIREKASIMPINNFFMKKRLSWFGQVQRIDGDNIAKSVLNTQIDECGPKGRPKMR